MEIKGILKERTNSQSGTSARTGNPWRTDEWLFEVPGNYTKRIVFEVRGVERCKEWEAFYNGMPNKNITPVLIKFEVNASPFEKDGKTRWINHVEAWSIEVTSW